MSGTIFHSGLRNQVYVSLNFVLSVIGTTASLLTLILIRRMNSKTGHVYLVFVMSIYQLLYDVTFFFSNVNCGYYITVAANVIQLSCGIGGSLVSNWIAYIALYTVWYRQCFDIFQNELLIQLSCFIPGLGSAIFFLATMVPKSEANAFLANISVVYVYYYIRLVSILLNFIFVLAIALRIYQRSSNMTILTDQEVAIRTLCRRMVFYPVIQAIGRSGYAWYEAEYGFNLDQDDATNTQFAAMLCFTIMTPIVSVGYLIIFLIMQPNAYREFLSMLSFTHYEGERISEKSFTGSKPSIYRQRPSSMRASQQQETQDVRMSTLNFDPDNRHAANDPLDADLYSDQSGAELEMRSTTGSNYLDWNRQSQIYPNGNVERKQAPIHYRDDEDLMLLINAQQIHLRTSLTTLPNTFVNNPILNPVIVGKSRDSTPITFIGPTSSGRDSTTYLGRASMGTTTTANGGGSGSGGDIVGHVDSSVGRQSDILQVMKSSSIDENNEL
jgi:hypothetical protein